MIDLRPRAAWRCEDDEEDQTLADGVEAMVYASAHENDRAGMYGTVLLGYLYLSATAYDVVDFVFGVRPLRVGLARFEKVQAHAQMLGRCEEFKVTFAQALLKRNEVNHLKGIHKAPILYHFGANESDRAPILRQHRRYGLSPL